MRKMLMLLALAAIVVLVGWTTPAQAQLAEVSQAITELTDHEAVGKRTNVDMNKRGGADVGQTAKAAGLLQEALNKTSEPKAKAQLELAVAYAKAHEHKEARLSAQGAMYYLCQSGGGAGCENVPKFGSYVAP